ncbi:hypothetical protein RHAB21_03697 [Pseudorhizobium halotolerans]|jgi:hypothetical protein|uniref:Uncharacterized protein n=1 Tax=Pseudorhizobium halotolerans TaxID=1233081 RepID=A0ABM8PSX5_9HYPH|nr:hypothetical protein RHAB21_03697 [Pseudorhizobium halotolerans]
MKRLGIVIGALAILMGLLWMAQGSGIFPYPLELHDRPVAVDPLRRDPGAGGNGADVVGAAVGVLLAQIRNFRILALT